MLLKRLFFFVRQRVTVLVVVFIRELSNIELPDVPWKLKVVPPDCLGMRRKKVPHFFCLHETSRLVHQVVAGKKKRHTGALMTQMCQKVP